jgi:predicted MFS family arabinose efflux permease
VLRSRDRSGAYLIALCVGTALFGMFFFLTLFLQDVWGYSALKSGVAYLPIMATVMVMSGAASQLVPRVGARPLLIAGSVIAAGGLFWLSQLTEHSSYAGGMLGPMMVTAAGIGLMFVPMSLVALSKVADADAGVASSLLNTGQQIGGSVGLAVLGTVAWSAVASSLRSGAAQSHALVYGFSRGFVVSAVITLLTLVVALVMLRVKRADLAGINPMAAPAD